MTTENPNDVECPCRCGNPMHDSDEVTRLRAELDAAREAVHYANGVADLGQLLVDALRERSRQRGIVMTDHWKDVTTREP